MLAATDILLFHRGEYPNPKLEESEVKVTITGRHIKLSDDMRAHAEEKMHRVEAHFGHFSVSAFDIEVGYGDEVYAGERGVNLSVHAAHEPESNDCYFHRILMILLCY